MSSLGSHLRELRERRGHSLDEVSRATRVNRPYLEALEASAIQKLPAPVIARGFIRAYCEALGEPSERAIALYDARARETAAPRVEVRKSQPRPVRGRHRPVLASFVLLVVLGVALFAVTRMLQAGRRTPTTARAERGLASAPAAATRETSQPAASPDGSQAPSPAERPSSGSGTTPAPAAPSPPAPASAQPAITAAATTTATPSRSNAPVAAPTSEPTASPSQPRESVVQNPVKEAERIASEVTAPYRLTARTTERTWMRVRTEDGGSTEETIPAEQVREWVSNRRLTVSIGNAAGVNLEFNGKSLPRLGTRGQGVPKLVLPPSQTP